MEAQVDSVESFRFNLKCLLRVGYPEGIKLHDLEGLYLVFAKKTVVPGSILPDARDWEDVFLRNPELRLTFVVSRKGEFLVVKLKNGGNETKVDEVLEVMELLSHRHWIPRPQTTRTRSISTSTNSTETDESVHDGDVSCLGQPLSASSKVLHLIDISQDSDVDDEIGSTHSGSAAPSAESSKNHGLTTSAHIMTSKPATSAVNLEPVNPSIRVPAETAEENDTVDQADPNEGEVENITVKVERIDFDHASNVLVGHVPNVVVGIERNQRVNVDGDATPINQSSNNHGLPTSATSAGTTMLSSLSTISGIGGCPSPVQVVYVQPPYLRVETVVKLENDEDDIVDQEDQDEEDVENTTGNEDCDGNVPVPSAPDVVVKIETTEEYGVSVEEDAPLANQNVPMDIHQSDSISPDAVGRAAFSFELIKREPMMPPTPTINPLQVQNLHQAGNMAGTDTFTETEKRQTSSGREPNAAMNLAEAKTETTETTTLNQTQNDTDDGNANSVSNAESSEGKPQAGPSRPRRAVGRPRKNATVNTVKRPTPQSPQVTKKVKRENSTSGQSPSTEPTNNVLEDSDSDSDMICYSHRLHTHYTVVVEAKITAALGSPMSPQEEFEKLCASVSNLPAIDRRLYKWTVDSAFNSPNEWCAVPVSLSELRVNTTTMEGNELRGFYKRSNGSDSFTSYLWYDPLDPAPSWVKCNYGTFELPPNTIVYGEFVEQVKSGRVTFDVIDCLCLLGRNMSYLSIHARRNMVQIYCDSNLNKLPGKTTIRLKNMYPMTQMNDRIFKRLSSFYTRRHEELRCLPDTYDRGQHNPVCGIVFLQTMFESSATDFTFAMDTRYFWLFESELALSSTDSLVSINNQEASLWHFLEKIKRSRANES